MTNEEMKNAQERFRFARACEDCLFSQRLVMNEEKEDYYWECRRNPPAYSAEHSFAFPSVDRHDWCGEFIEDSTEEAED